jgi:hypothetical protein
MMKKMSQRKENAAVEEIKSAEELSERRRRY